MRRGVKHRETMKKNVTPSDQTAANDPGWAAALRNKTLLDALSDKVKDTKRLLGTVNDMDRTDMRLTIQCLKELWEVV